MKVDLKLFAYLKQFDNDVKSLDKAFTFLVQSLSGDEYYLCEWLPNDGVISLDLGEQVYKIVQDMSPTEIFELRNAVVGELAEADKHE